MNYMPVILLLILFILYAVDLCGVVRIPFKVMRLVHAAMYVVLIGWIVWELATP
jgi:hypothetical protein